MERYVSVPEIEGRLKDSGQFFSVPICVFAVTLWDSKKKKKKFSFAAKSIVRLVGRTCRLVSWLVGLETAAMSSSRAFTPWLERVWK